MSRSRRSVSTAASSRMRDLGLVDLGAALPLARSRPAGARRSARSRRRPSRAGDAARASSLWRRRSSCSSVSADVDHRAMAGRPARRGARRRPAAALGALDPVGRVGLRPDAARPAGARPRPGGVASIVARSSRPAPRTSRSRRRAASDRGLAPRQPARGLVRGGGRRRPRSPRRPRGRRSACSSSAMAAATRARSSWPASCSALPRTSASPAPGAPAAGAPAWRRPERTPRREPRGARRRPTARPASASTAAVRGGEGGRRRGAARSRPPPCGAGPRRARRRSPRRRPAPRRQPVADEPVAVRVTTTAAGWARATSRASAHGPATTTARCEQAVEQAVDRRVDGADVVADAARRASRPPAPGGGPAAARTAPPTSDLVEVVEGAPRRPGVGDDHRGERLAQRGLDRGLPAGVDLDQVEQRAEHAVDAGQALGAGPGAGGVERQGEGLGPRRSTPCAARPRPRAAAPASSAVVRAAVRAASAAAPARSTSGASASSACASRVARPRRPRRAPACRSPSVASAASARAQLVLVGLVRRCAERASSPRTSAAARAARVVSGRPAVPSPRWCGRTGRRRPPGAARARPPPRPPRGRRRPAPRRPAASATAASSDRRRAASASRLATTLASISCTAVALEAAPALGEHGREAAGPLPQRLDAHEQVAEVGRAAGAQAGLGRQDLGVEPGQVPPHGLVLLAQVPLLDGQALQPPLQAGDLPAGDVDPQRGQLGDHLAVAAGGLGLALQRAQLAADLAQQVLDPQQVGLGGVEPALGLLLALAELEDAGRLLDDGPPVLRAGVEDGVDLALADDHVLLAADAGVAEELLDVEQAAGHAVDGVLAVARCGTACG